MRCLFFLLYLLPIVTQAEISVVTSIRPLYQITAAIMQGTGTPELLIKSDHSAHHFALKPSHFSLLQQADLVIWIDRHFENGFLRLAEILTAKSRRLELLPVLGLKNADGHIWYSPSLLMKISNQITHMLSELDRANQSVYQRNNGEFQHEITLWKQEVKRIIDKRNPRYLLDHDFLNHFETEFHLKAIAVIHDNHDQQVGIQALQTIEQKLKTQLANCLISNDTDFSRLGKNLARQFSLTRHSINSFANEGDVASRFIRHLNHFAEILRSC